MILLIELLFAATIALVFSLVLVLIFRWERPTRKGPWASFVFLFLLMFLFTWAVGAWISPFGPMLWNVYWMPFGFAGLGLALLLAATDPSRKPRPIRIEQEQKKSGEDLTVREAFGISFWILVLALIIAIVAHYVA